MVEYRQNSNGFKVSTIYKKPLSVGQAAKISQVSKKTVLNWIYRGALNAFTTLGGHYRIWPVELYQFFARTGMDIPFRFIDEKQSTLLIIDCDSTYTNQLKWKLEQEFPSYDIIASNDCYEALVLIGERKPQIVVLDITMPRLDGLRVLELLKEKGKNSPMKIIINSPHFGTDMYSQHQMALADAVIDKNDDSYEFINFLKGAISPNAIHQTINRIPVQAV
jgi:excisionase family DNA binding protein